MSDKIKTFLYLSIQVSAGRSNQRLIQVVTDFEGTDMIEKASKKKFAVISTPHTIGQQDILTIRFSQQFMCPKIRSLE